MTRTDPHDPLGWEWRAEYRMADADFGYPGEWQINAYPGGGNSPCWLASGGPEGGADDARVAHLMAAAPDLYRALAQAKTRLLVCGEWAGWLSELGDAALRKAQAQP